jgi:type I restriction enzyme M protein
MEEIQNIVNNIDTSNIRPNVKKEIDKWKATAFDWAYDYMYGIEKDYRLVKTAKVGCYLHGDGIATVIH